MDRRITLDRDLRKIWEALAFDTPIPKISENDVFEDVATKHLPGQHDQRSHGNWAGEGRYTQAMLFAERDLPPVAEEPKAPEPKKPEEPGEIIVYFSGSTYSTGVNDLGLQFDMDDIINSLEESYYAPGLVLTIEVDDESYFTEAEYYLDEYGHELEDPQLYEEAEAHLYVTIIGTIGKLVVNEDGWDDEIEIGEFEDRIVRGFSEAHGREVDMLDAHWLSLEVEHQDKGISKELAFNKLLFAHSLGLDGMAFSANSTLGRYAWAKYGASFADPKDANTASIRFRQFAQNKKIPEPSIGWPEFKTPYEIATYDHPEGHSLTSEEIYNPDVREDEVYNLGKAFMLDMGFASMGNWAGVVWINQP